MKTYGWVEVYLHAFLTTTLGEVSIFPKFVGNKIIPLYTLLKSSLQKKYFTTKGLNRAIYGSMLVAEFTWQHQQAAILIGRNLLTALCQNRTGVVQIIFRDGTQAGNQLHIVVSRLQWSWRRWASGRCCLQCHLATEGKLFTFQWLSSGLWRHVVFRRTMLKIEAARSRLYPTTDHTASHPEYLEVNHRRTNLESHKLFTSLCWHTLQTLV
jgi:hypothetical protein